ncbi:hypothetical protein [Flavobacterium sp.]|uniref:hypothetical protein n=1 Tax=Flavobacterium sp. TaxID=239 RepID=UPI0038FBFA5C
MKKLVFISLLFLVNISISCKRNLESSYNSKGELVAPDSLKAIYEGKVVKSTIGQWYLIKDGFRWRTNSIKATNDYFKKNPSDTNSVMENVSIEVLHQFPESGELMPGVVFIKDGAN